MDRPRSKRGKRAKACDACFRSKLACDGSSPCARCHSRGMTCVYTRVHGAITNATTDPPAAAPSTSTVLKTPASPQDDSTKIPVAFLLSLTNPKAGSMLEAFLGEPSRGDELPSAELQPDIPLHPDPYQSTAISDGFFLTWLFDQPHPDATTSNTTFPFPPSPRPHNPPPHRAHPPELTPPSNRSSPRSEPCTAPSPPPRPPPTPPYNGTYDAAPRHPGLHARPPATPSCPPNFRLHAPATCRSCTGRAFDPKNFAGPPLPVGRVLLCGALYAPPRDCVLAVRGFFAVVEEWVFRRLEGLVEGVEGGGGGGGIGEDGEREMELYGTFQAALLIHGAQFIMNNPALREQGVGDPERPALVVAARRLGLTRGAACVPCGVANNERIVTWTFIGDWQQGGVTHQPGLATIHEMTGDLPSLPDLWEANNATEFEAAIAANGPNCWRRTASLRDSIQVMIGVSRLVSVLQTTIPAIQRATDRWQELWQESVPQPVTIRTCPYLLNSATFTATAGTIAVPSLTGYPGAPNANCRSESREPRTTFQDDFFLVWDWHASQGQPEEYENFRASRDLPDQKTQSQRDLDRATRWWMMGRMFEAAERGKAGAMKLQKSVEIDLLLEDSGGWVSLLFAAGKGYKEVVRYLLDKGAAVDVVDGDGQTSLSLAASAGHEAVVQQLLDNGADVDVTSSWLQHHNASNSP
ncbi:hypothetical protein CHGG_05447 [Chaetomium globosum CBS 148.51]|uniref:Zn(2)-C6 fungal-type domain-containing protein n=1 Tax=Chaetomium globosum (strain ATCC 6205 / CBS 148.51 / DSM 1962 / NBRC 6347 / NRRL 1970) TaxID=306901 RepID=Q2H7B8_CHAGB|nr:uncharacterized protein CHGG_05447 [Chaetomium globosum CBS 148.51]EAQ88828.1 hypothetical protein CHGG_05447 [Chaetomium globosum CBS 148.51]